MLPGAEAAEPAVVPVVAAAQAVVPAGFQIGGNMEATHKYGWVNLRGYPLDGRKTRICNACGDLVMLWHNGCHFKGCDFYNVDWEMRRQLPDDWSLEQAHSSLGSLAYRKKVIKINKEIEERAGLQEHAQTCHHCGTPMWQKRFCPCNGNGWTGPKFGGDKDE